MAVAAQAVALLLTEHAREPFAGPVLAYRKQAMNVGYDGTLWMFESLAIQPHPDGMLDPPPGDAPIDFARLVRLLGLGALQTLDADLNRPAPPELIGRFGLIVDGGAMERVFDLRQGMKNTADLLRPGGRAVHLSAANNHVNQGFVQLSPTFFHDYYVENGFDDVRGMMIARARTGSNAKRWNIFPYDDDTLGGVNSMFCSAETQLDVYFTARKNPASTSDRVPLQSYFRRLNEGRDLVPYQFIVTYNPALPNVRLVSDPESRAGKVNLFPPIWTLGFESHGRET